ATLAASRLLHRSSPTAPCSKGALAAHRKKLAAFSALGGDCGSRRGPGSVIILRTISRSALTSAIRRFVSSPLSACGGALRGGGWGGLGRVGFLLSTFHVVGGGGGIERNGERIFAINQTRLLEVTRALHARIVPHGFRSSFRDWSAERTTFPSEVAEMALAHVVGNKVEAAYRRGDMFEKRSD